MVQPNHTILNRLNMLGSTDYQQRVPLASKNDISATQRFLFDPMNGKYFNEFAENLVNLIGSTIVNDHNWSNPLAIFKRADFTDGRAIEEIALDYIKSSGYDPEDNNIFKRSRPEIFAAFHTQNRQDRYDITLNRFELRKAFNSENGLNDLLNKILAIPGKSAEYDEFSIMKDLIAISNSENPLYNVQAVITNELSPTAEELKVLSYKIRATAKRLAVAPTGLYNSKGVPTVSKASDLVLITIPEIMAALDVNVLADAFNISKTDIVQSVIELDEMPIEGAHAILVDKNWFVAGDTLTQVTEFNNPKSLEYNFYLHKWGAYSTSPFNNAIMFSNSADTNVNSVTVALTAIAAAVYDSESVLTTSVKAGSSDNKLIVTPTGTITPATPDFIVPGEYTTTLTAYTETITPGEGEEDPDIITLSPVNLSNRTRIDRNGKLHVQSNLVAGTKINIAVESAYINPDTATTTPLTAETVVTVS